MSLDAGRVRVELSSRRRPWPPRQRCEHKDVRYFVDEGGAIACCACGRLFGHLRGDGTFVPHNPPQGEEWGT